MPAARLALHLLQDDGHRLGHHLLHDVTHRLAVRLELLDQRGEDAEVPLLALEAHARKAPVHRLGETAMRGDDLTVEVLRERALIHGRSIERRSRRFNEIALAAALGALLLAGAAGAVELPGTGGRVTAGGYVDGLAVAETEGGPSQQPQALVALRLDAMGTRALSGHLELRGRAGGPFVGGHPGFYNLVHEFQNYSPALELNEAYVDLRFERADVRAGVQKVVWGKLDGVPPTDVVNPRDFHDPLVDDAEERKIGIPGVLATYYLPDLPRFSLTGMRASALYVPFAVPPRLALAEERWFPSSTVPQTRFVLRTAGLGLPLPPRLVIPVAFGTRSRRPPHDLEDGGIALRLGGTWGDQDWALYHYTGPETVPDAKLRPTLYLVDANPFRLRIQSELLQKHDVIHMTGGDWAGSFGGATVRAEAAWFVGRPYLRPASDLVTPEAIARLPLDRLFRRLSRRGQTVVPLADLFPTRDSVEWGVGADYLVRGFLPLVQVNQIVLLEPAPPLLIADPETRLSGSLRKRLLGERLELEVRGTYAIEREAWWIFPRASYHVRDDLRVRLGYLAVGGPRRSIFGQFADNDEVVLQARYSF